MTANSMLIASKDEGLKEGEAIGLEKGKKLVEQEKNIVAKKLLKKGFSIEDICDTTGLTQEQLKELII